MHNAEIESALELLDLVHSDQPSDPRNEELSQIGFKYFVAASMQCPASVAGQAAVIALRCKESGENPEALRDALIRDNDKIRKIQQAAIHAHSARGKGPVEPAYIKVPNFVRLDFNLAQQMMCLDETYLSEVSTNMYQRSLHPSEIERALQRLMGFTREDRLRRNVRVKIKEQTGFTPLKYLYRLLPF